jgi:sugar lactone lactonase YvrE
MPQLDVRVALDASAEVGEGPVWDERRKVLIWVDIYRGEVHLFDPVAGEDVTFNVGQPVGAAASTTSGDLVLALRDGFGRLDPTTGRMQMVAPVEADLRDNLMNDGKCDRAGRFLAGTTTLSETPGAGALYRLNSDSSVETILADVTLSNGIDWSPDGTAMYYVDSHLQRVDVLDYDDRGAASGRRTLVEIPHTAGMPDGLTVDASGYIWVALWGGSAVHRFSPNGDLDRVIPVPVSFVTSCAFGGPDLEDLYITSSSWEFDAARFRVEPNAGALFVTRPGAAGLPPTLARL